MQIIHQNKNKEGNSKRTYTMNFDIYIYIRSVDIQRKKKFSRKDDKLTKIAKLKQTEQDSYTIDKFV